MGRLTVHSPDHVLDATRELVLQRGPVGATVAEVSAGSGAPMGSLYHRFGSRDELLARLWIRAARRAQERFLSALAVPEDPAEAALAAALALYDFCVEQREDASLLVCFRREDLVRGRSSPAMLDELAALNRPLERALTALAARLDGRTTRQGVERVALATVDIPHGAVRRHLIARTPLPAALRGHIETAVRAVLDT